MTCVTNFRRNKTMFNVLGNRLCASINRPTKQTAGFCVICGLLAASGRAEDSDMFRPYIQVRSASFNENWGVKDGWGLSLGANLDEHWGVELSFDIFQMDIEGADMGFPQFGVLTEQSIGNLTPMLRYRYPIGEAKRWVPYVFGGPGVTFLQINDDKEPTYHKHLEGDSTQLSATVGGGLEYFVADNITFNIEGRYAWVDSAPVVYDGVHRKLDFSSPLLMLGLRAYFRENHPHKLLQQEEHIPSRFYLGFRYGAEIQLDRKLNSDLSFDSLNQALSGTGNLAGGVLFGYDIGEHFGIELAANYTEATLVSQQYGRLGEYSQYTVVPQLRWRWPLLDGRVAPFVYAGGGLTYAEWNDRKPAGENLNVEGRGAYPAAVAGSGLEYFVARNLSFSAEGQYYASWNHKITIDKVNAGKASYGNLSLYLGMRVYLAEH